MHKDSWKNYLLIERVWKTGEIKSRELPKENLFKMVTCFWNFISGASGAMEVLNCGGMVAPEEYLSLQIAIGSIITSVCKIQRISREETVMKTNFSSNYKKTN